ncbi:hypothetical protein B0H13DRAFT_1630707 [Mycena leptocephala]|nr:hypothetical protein B0H13DRAFT_1630707 [Mycena leptocephala]
MYWSHRDEEVGGFQGSKKLHCLPLAVVHAGAYIASSLALHTYLKLYESTEKRAQLLNERPQQSEYGWLVYTTWQISFEKLPPQAAQLLQLCSFLHHDGITEGIFEKASSYKVNLDGLSQEVLRKPLEFLAAFLDSSASIWDSLKFTLVTQELGQYSLSDLQASSRTITFSIHPLIHEWCRATIKSAATQLCMHRLMGMALAPPEVNFAFQHQVFPHPDTLLFNRV